MRKSLPAADPDAYVAALGGWQQKYVAALREAVLGAAVFEEVIKWGHLVYYAHGPVLLIRAEDERVLFGFWRGQRLRGIEPRLKPGGKYEMATLVLQDGTPLEREMAIRLAAEAARLNLSLGNPTTLPNPGPAHAGN
ncbi:MAG: DUF1801 domain-containing protein [Pseudomonadota bacterium]